MGPHSSVRRQSSRRLAEPRLKVRNAEQARRAAASRCSRSFDLPDRPKVRTAPRPGRPGLRAARQILTSRGARRFGQMQARAARGRFRRPSRRPGALESRFGMDIHAQPRLPIPCRRPFRPIPVQSICSRAAPICRCPSSTVGNAGRSPIEKPPQTWPMGWWAVQDSNLRHPRCKRGALTAELTAREAAVAAQAASRPVLVSRRPPRGREISGRGWCPGRDLNPDGLLHTPLKRTRIPIPPPGHETLSRRLRAA